MRGTINASVRRRIWTDKFFKALMIVLSLGSIVPMFLILFMITREGISVINWEFLTSLPAPVGESGGGIVIAFISGVYEFLNIGNKIHADYGRAL